MTAVREPTPIFLDASSSGLETPYGIITVDPDGAHKFEDGFSVTPLPSDHEMYQVRVFAADPSELYFNDDVIKHAIRQGKSNPVFDSEGNFKTHRYLLDPELTEGMYFDESSRPLGALIVSFVVGSRDLISDPLISYGQVEVTKNYRFTDFGDSCRSHDAFKSYGRAAALILSNLSSAGVSDLDIRQALLRKVPEDAITVGGVNINQAFMLAANHIAAGLMRKDQRPALYRINSRKDGTKPIASIAPPKAPLTVGADILLDSYTRITSPLRRAEDLVMHGQLRQRHLGNPPNSRDIYLMRETVRRLNPKPIEPATAS